jgi:hypothetical protein
MSARLLLLCLLFRSSWLTVESGRGRRRHSAASPGRTGSRDRVGRRRWWRSEPVVGRPPRCVETGGLHQIRSRPVRRSSGSSWGELESDRDRVRQELQTSAFRESARARRARRARRASVALVVDCARSRAARRVLPRESGSRPRRPLGLMKAQGGTRFRPPRGAARADASPDDRIRRKAQARAGPGGRPPGSTPRGPSADSIRSAVAASAAKQRGRTRPRTAGSR